MKNLKYYLNKAQKENWAIGQFNFSTFEQLKGILTAIKRTKSPVILGTSEGESKFLGLAEIVNLVNFYRKKLNLPIFLNLDHGKSFEALKEAIEVGYDIVHFDGSELPFGKNLKLTKKVVENAHKKGILIEGEIGKIGQAWNQKKSVKTDPKEVKDFVKKTRINLLAISIGNIHGVQKRMPKLDFERLKEIKKITKTFLVLHGGSGIPTQELKKAIEFGIAKINSNTDLRLAWRKSLENSLRENPKEIRPYKILPQVILAVQKAVEEKIKLFGSTNKI